MPKKSQINKYSDYCFFSFILPSVVALSSRCLACLRIIMDCIQLCCHMDSMFMQKPIMNTFQFKCGENYTKFDI